MCNCGKKRAGLGNTASSIKATPPVPVTTVRAMTTTFKYIGFSSLTVTGSSTGKTYIFARHGDTQMVEGSDSAFLSGITVLKRM